MMLMSSEQWALSNSSRNRGKLFVTGLFFVVRPFFPVYFAFVVPIFLFKERCHQKRKWNINMAWHLFLFAGIICLKIITKIKLFLSEVVNKEERMIKTAIFYVVHFAWVIIFKWNCRFSFHFVSFALPCK